MSCLHHILAASVLVTAAGLTRADQGGFTPLFDGKTFQGWEGNRGVL